MRITHNKVFQPGVPLVNQQDWNADHVLGAAELTSGEWTGVPSIFRLRLTGTGTCVLDARDSLGNITLAVESYVATAATDQIEFPFLGDNAIELRATLTGTCAAEVI